MCLQVNHMLVLLLVLISGTLSAALLSPDDLLRDRPNLMEGITQQERQIQQENSPLWMNCVLKGNCNIPETQKDIFKKTSPMERRNVMLAGTRMYNLRTILHRVFSLVMALKHRIDSPQGVQSLSSFLDTWQPAGRRQKSFIKRLHTCPFLNRVGFSPSICTLPRAHKLRRQRQTLAKNNVLSHPVRRYPTGFTNRLHDSWPVLHLLGGALGKRTIT